MRKFVIILSALFIGVSVFAQKERTLTLNEETNLIDVVYYHDNGEVSQTGSYTVDGKLQGQWLSFNKEGEKIVTAYYKEGKKVRKWIYLIDGKTKEVDYSKNGTSI